MEAEIGRWLNWLDGRVATSTRDGYAWDVRRLAAWGSARALRRTAACLTVEAGAPTRVAMELFRWRNMAELERYTAALRLAGARKYLPVDRLLGPVGC